MKTPVYDFVKEYTKKNAVHAHMPAHKGIPVLGPEPLDITEIEGAGNLYLADGIIAESEQNASTLFGAETFYSAEGSSLAVRAMIYLALKHYGKAGGRPVIAAGRNAHRSFVSAAALLGVDVAWLYGENPSYISCEISAAYLDGFLSEQTEKPFAVYITSPDYVGNIADVKGLSEICKKHGLPLLIDNAHGAYLKFLPKSLHPVDLGATICCDSAHKTLPVLTGGAYLHVANTAPDNLKAEVKASLALFGSTSPSYLILQSLDLANACLNGNFRDELKKTVARIAEIKTKLAINGYFSVGNESLKISLATKPYGYTGKEINTLLIEKAVVSEFYDNDFITLMLSPYNSEKDFTRLENALLNIPAKPKITKNPPPIVRPEKALTVREATLAPSETVSVSNAKGRILSDAATHCPPAVPILVSGEIIDDYAVAAFNYYGIKTCSVVKE